jgi:hypothetical protein
MQSRKRFICIHGAEAIKQVVYRYYQETEEQVEAMVQLNNFRSRTGVYNQATMTHMALHRTPDEYWAHICNYELPSKPGPPLFRKLVNAYAGQGECERMNKSVKKHRTTNRNRQQHEVTQAYMEIDSIQRMLRSQEQPPKVPYLECIRHIIEEIEEETKEEDEELQRLLDEEDLANEEKKTEDDDDDDNDDNDVVDIGRQTIINMFRYGVNTRN